MERILTLTDFSHNELAISEVILFQFSVPSYCIEIQIHSFVFSLEGRAWQEPEPSCDRYGSGTLHPEQVLGVVCHCFPPPLDVPTLAARCLRPQRRERS